MGSVEEDVKEEKAHTLEAAGGEDFTSGTGVDGETFLTVRESPTVPPMLCLNLEGETESQGSLIRKPEVGIP